jgi:hypothetical protein
MPDTSWPQSRFVPEPHVSGQVDRSRYDIIVCPRRRKYGAEKNWPEWHALTVRIVEEGFTVFAAGAPDSSYEVPCESAWQYDRFLDASIEAIRGATLVVATDAGLAHLAVLCGTPLLLITHGLRGLVAPGPIVDETGKHLEDSYWPIKIERYNEANHTGSPIYILKDAWYDPLLTFAEIMRRMMS